MVKIFLTGATGYVGGQALRNLYNTSTPPPEISVLNRHVDSESGLLKDFPNIRIVRGDLDDTEVIEDEAEKADIVFHIASTNHLPSAEAISKGLSKRSKPGYWIQISGASMFSGSDIKNGTLGQAPKEEFNDIQDAEKIRSIVLENPNRKVDHLVLSQDPAKVKTALIIGPLFYGEGQGSGKTRSIQAPEMARVTLEKGQGFRVGAGKSVWNNLHVRDLGTFFEKVLKAAVVGKEGCWNHEGVYGVENGQLSFGAIGELIAKEAHAKGLIDSAEVKYEMSPEEADKAMPHGSVLWATNAVVEAERARKLLNWEPSHESLEKTISDVVDVEAKKLGK